MKAELMAYVQHKYDCDWLQPMWHQGPCDCGLTALVLAMPADERRYAYLCVRCAPRVASGARDLKPKHQEKLT